MPLTILDLGDDLLASEIPKYISPDDIFGFSIVNKSIYDLYHCSTLSTRIYQILYNKKFTNNENNYTISLKNKLNWKQLFQLRCSPDQKVYTWGEPQNGRLGYLTSRIDHSHVTMGGWAVHTPTNIPEFNNHIIIDIVANGFSFIILTNSGELWFTGSTWKGVGLYRLSTPGPINQKDYLPLSQEVPTLIEETGEPDFNHPPSIIQETNFLTRLNLPPNEQIQTTRKIISISTGREHIIALDNHNNIYSWDPGCSTNMGVHISFPGIDAQALIMKIVAGWNLSACTIAGYGLIIWYSRIPINKRQCQRHDFESNAHYFIVPFTKDDIVDFTVGSDYVLYIKRSEDKLYQIRFNVHEFATRSINNSKISNDELFNCISPMKNFNDWKMRFESQGEEHIKFTKLNSCFHNFVVFTNHDQILIGSKAHLEYINSDDDEDRLEGANPKIIPELQGQNIKRLVIGDYHYMALTNEGDILSWGRESSGCGCLGLGMSDIVATENPHSCRIEGSALVVTKPLPVKNPPFPGKWVAITASGWHSGGIYVPIDNPKKRKVKGTRLNV